ncbi:MAG: hypothetical protein JSS46_13760 [Proteobacteria bacterium]|nr:hypothetical protein [Pseudomonadota bacterium]
MAPDAFGPWHPGIESTIPDALRPQSTILRPGNVFTGVARAAELHDLTGLPLAELVAWRPERLALHELLVRVTASVSVPDPEGSRIEDLGINFREIVGRILERCVEPRMDEITSAWSAARRELTDLVSQALAEALAASSPLPARPAQALSRLRNWFAQRREWRRPDADRASVGGDTAGVEPAFDVLTRRIAHWEQRAREAPAEAERAASRALAKVVSAVLVRHGAIWGSRELIASLAVDIACNEFGSDEIGRLVEAWIADGAAKEGCARLPRQSRPVIMNTKGPSASGKSTVRPLQKKLARGLGVDWSEFALISPDIWRKQLLDYSSLGDAYKYGGAFTGEELHIVDRKLDRYMAQRAANDDVPHLLIDRFRFDSFAPDSNEAGSNLLTRFGQVVYLFLMIAPPEMLVERAWKRGLDVGRYKAVDDTLAHAVEAYSGMPDLFFTWIDRPDKDVHFEFLDNGVPNGELPRTAAFGHNRKMNVLDVGCLIDIERFCRIDVDATAPELLYRDRRLLAAALNAGFLERCIARFPEVAFADQATGRVYARTASGALAWVDREGLARAFEDIDTRDGLLAAVPALRDVVLPDAAPAAAVSAAVELPAAEPSVFLRDDPDAAALRTIGRWGP